MHSSSTHSSKPSWVWGVVAMALIVVASNILVQFFVGEWLTWGAFTYPFAFLVTDVINRVYGKDPASWVVFWGFLTGIVCSLIGTQIMGEFGPLVTPRITIGSGTAFLVAHTCNVLVFDRLRAGTWWRAPIVSTFVGSTIDTLLFFFVAFSAGVSGMLGVDHNTEFFNEMVAHPFGGETTRWLGTAMVDWTVKVSTALLALVPFRVLTKRWGTKKTNHWNITPDGQGYP